MIERSLRGNDIFFRRVGAAIEEVADDFDIVVIDCPPQPWLPPMGALNAATCHAGHHPPADGRCRVHASSCS